MNKQDKIKTFVDTYKLRNDIEKWLDDLPREIQAGFYDNPFVDGLYLIIELLEKKIYTENELNDIYWFVYDRTTFVHDSTITVDDVDYKIENLDEFVAYINEKWEES